MIFITMNVRIKVIPILFSLSLIGLLVSAGTADSIPETASGTPASQQERSLPLPPTKVRIELVFLEGEVLINGQKPEIGDLLDTNFIIQTGRGARCDIVFNSGNALSVGQNALAHFDFTSQVASVRLDRGGLSSVVKKLPRIAGTDAFSVQTATAVAGVRGTSFCVWVDEASSYICACNGVLSVADSAGGNTERIEAAHHSARYFSRSGGIIRKETAGLRHHSDELLQSVASRIAYSIDWTSLDS